VYTSAVYFSTRSLYFSAAFIARKRIESTVKTGSVAGEGFVVRSATGEASSATQGVTNREGSFHGNRLPAEKQVL